MAITSIQNQEAIPHGSLSNQPLSQQPTALSATNRSLSVVERVLELRRKLNIDINLSNSEPEVTTSPTETSHPVPLPDAAQYANTNREWLAWSQSPNDATPMEKRQKIQQTDKNRAWLAWSQSPNDGEPPEKVQQANSSREWLAWSQSPSDGKPPEHD